MSFPALAQSDQEQRYIEAVTEAETALAAAEQQLAEARRTGEPLIAEYESLSERDRELTRQLNAAMDDIDRAQNNVDRIPVELDARFNALADILVRMYENGADPDDIAEKERQLADVRRQIERLQAGNNRARQVVDRAFERAENIRRLRNDIRRRMSDMEFNVMSARTRIRQGEDGVAQARDELERARSNARWRLNESPPPFLASVEVKAKGKVVYQSDWTEPAKDAEERLKLAQYLHEDLTRSIERRREHIDQWIEIVEEDQRKAQEALDAYVSMIGGSYDGGFMGWLETTLDKVTFGYGGALVTGGSHTWKRIGVEAVDAAVTIGRDIASGVPPHAAVAQEALFQVADALKGNKSPGWDVTDMPMANDAIRQSTRTVSVTEEQQLLASINKSSVMASLEKMRSQIAAGALDGENFRDALFREYGGATLAAAMTEATFRAEMPDMKIDERPILGKSPYDWVFAQYTQPAGLVKTLLKDATWNDPDSRYGRDVWLDVIQNAVKDGIMEQLERDRLRVWEAYIMADIELRLSIAQLKNQGRIRRMDEKLRKVLADEVIPELTAEIERLRQVRELEITKRDAVTGRMATIRLTFNQPVKEVVVRLDETQLEVKGSGKDWRAKFNPDEFEAGEVQMHVEAIYAALDDRALDNPQTVAAWSTTDKRFNNYEQGTDSYHKLLLEPPEGIGFAIVLDTSGSMDDNNRMVNAKAALADLFASGRIKDEDKTALFTFSSCSTANPVPFTNDLAAVSSAAQNAGTGGSTPLASSILYAAQALSEQNVERGVLVVVTDGEDSCDGDVIGSVRQARQLVDNIKRRLVR